MSDQVKRFNPPRVGKRTWPESMEPDPDGVYLYYSDHRSVVERLERSGVDPYIADALNKVEAERDQVTSLIHKAIEAVKALRDAESCSPSGSHRDSVEWAEMRLRYVMPLLYEQFEEEHGEKLKRVESAFETAVAALEDLATSVYPPTAADAQAALASLGALDSTLPTLGDSK